MKVAMTGGTGFIGSALARHFLEAGHEVTVIGSSRPAMAAVPPRMTCIQADTTVSGDWQGSIEGADVIVNLAGRTISGRWTRRYRRLLRDSRIRTTRHVVAAIPRGADPVLVSASAVGYYGDRGDDVLSESEGPGDDFLANLASNWEREAEAARHKGARLVIARFGVVLDRSGGAMGRMIPVFRYFLGGPLGNGRQWFSWIHMADLIRAMDFVIHTPGLAGPVNFCAPEPIRNRELAKRIGAALRRPAVFPAPAFALRLLLGGFGGTLVEGQRAVPEKLLHGGFSFHYPDIAAALSRIVSD